MVAFLKWIRSTVLGVLNGVAKFVFAMVLLLVALILFSLLRGDGMPGTMVLTMDLRDAIADSDASATSVISARHMTVMDIVLGLDAASRDSRVKGVILQLGNGALSTAQAQEIGEAVQRFRKAGKFTIAQATAFYGSGLGDYLAASSTNEIWMQPKSDFAVSGAGGGEIFLRGLLDKINAVPQIAKRAEYKSAADMYMEKDMSAPDREQLLQLMNSVYDSAVDQVAAARHLSRGAVIAGFEASPQFSEEARRARLIDRIGYDDEARAAATARAGASSQFFKFGDYVRNAVGSFGPANIAIVEAAGDIRDGTAKNSLLNSSSGIASDDLSAAIQQAAQDNDVKAIVLRVDSPGGSVSASDQILHAVKVAQKAGKPVVISMGSVAASGGYYISTSANKIVAEPGTITGSIGVLTGKVSFDKSVQMIGVNSALVSVGKNTLMDTPFQPYTSDQWAAVNRQADAIYDDFTAKVAAGRKLGIDKVRDIARGRVWSGRDAKDRGLVDGLGGFWTAAGMAASLGHVPAGSMAFKVYPRPTGVLGSLGRLLDGFDASLGLFGRVESLLNLPGVEAVTREVSQVPAGGATGGVQLRAAHLPQP